MTEFLYHRKDSCLSNYREYFFVYYRITINPYNNADIEYKPTIEDAISRARAFYIALAPGIEIHNNGANLIPGKNIVRVTLYRYRIKNKV